MYKELWKEKGEGAKVRSRIRDFEEGEKSTKFFFQQEKIISRAKLWHQIKGADGKIKLGIDNILDEQTKFY